MASRVKQPGAEIAQTSSAYHTNRDFVAAMNYLSRCLVSKIRVPDVDTVAIVSETGLNGSDLIEVLTSGASNIYNQPATAEVDLDVAGIGGLVSGVTKVDGDYLYWAFIDPESSTPFKGFGATKRPVETCTGRTGTGAKGSTTTFSGISSSNGFTFSIGARVIVQHGTAQDWTANWNQGVVTATTSTTVTVDLDNMSYGNAISNTSCLLTQTDRYEPLQSADGELYGGYRYAYLGHAQRDDGAITYTRQRGEFYYNPAFVTLNVTVSTPVTAPYTVDTGVFCGADTREVQVSMRAKRTAGAVGYSVWFGARVAAPATTLHIVISNNAATTTFDWENIVVRTALRADGTGCTAWYSSSQAGTVEIYLMGWHETRF